MTTGDNVLEFEGTEVTALSKAKQFVIDLKAQEEDSTPTNTKYKINGEENKSAGFHGTKSNNFFGGIVINAAALKEVVNDDYKMQRGYYLLTDSDSVDSIHIPLPLVTNPAVENVQLAIGFFDELSLLRGFEADGKTAKLVGTSTAGNEEKLTPKIFTDPDINLSTVPADIKKKFIVGIPWNEGDNQEAIAPAGTSVFMGESSVMGAGDVALAFRAWGEIGIVSGGLSPMYLKKEEGAWGWWAVTRKFTELDWIDLKIQQPSENGLELGADAKSYYSSDYLPPPLLAGNCVFKDCVLGGGISVRYRMAQQWKKGGSKKYASNIHIQVKIDPVLLPLGRNKYSVQASMDGGMAPSKNVFDKRGPQQGLITTSTSVSLPEGEGAGIEINYHMTKHGTPLDRYGKTKTTEMPYDHTQIFSINEWVPELIKVKFGLLGTNQ